VRIFIAGAGGVIGVRLVALLVSAGHEVAAMTRTQANAERLRVLGGEPVVCDVYDREMLGSAVARFQPEVVMHQLTDLPDDLERLPLQLGANARIRREGTRNLIGAARAAGASRLVAQSVAWQLEGESGAAVAEHERLVLDQAGVVVRYGQFYGPGTYYPSEPPAPPRVHVDEAARRTVPLITAPSGIVVVTEEAQEATMPGAVPG
jgi:nucleoside-diphosphate-sugar epimerase